MMLDRFYDVGPPAETQSLPASLSSIPVAKINMPVYGFYGSTDMRPLITLNATKAMMNGAGKRYELVIYDSADHALMHVGENPADRNPSGTAAFKASVARLRTLLKKSFK